MNATVGGLFDGCGLLAYGLHLAGWEHRWLCELDEFRQGILRQRFPGVPVYPDVRAVDGSAERPVLIAGGFPCKGGSTAGKREGLNHPETALWHEMARVVRDVRPRFVLIENVANLLAIHDGAVWGTVLGDLAAIGYDVEWDCLPAAAFGAPHRRDRVFAVATDTSVVGHERGRRARQGRAGLEDSREPLEDSDLGAVEPRWLWWRAGERDQVAVADTERRVHGHAGRADLLGAPRAGEVEAPQRERVRPNAADGVATPADPVLSGLEGRGLQGAATNGASTSAHATGARGQGARANGPALGGVARDRGVAVEWGDYRPAIERWEVEHGPAPEPLVRRVDDRGAARVERSRLSALGDGVQVQAGYFMGRLIMDRLA